MTKKKRYDCIGLTRTFYPHIFQRGYIIYTHVDRTRSDEYINKLVHEVAGEGRTWDDEVFILTGEIIVNSGFVGRREDGTVDHKIMPIFAEFKKAKLKKKVR